MKKSDDKYYRIYLYPSKHQPDDVKAYAFLEKLGRNKTEFIISLITGFLHNSDVTDVDSLSQEQALNLASSARTTFTDINPNILTNFLYNLIQNNKGVDNGNIPIADKEVTNTLDTSSKEDVKEDDFYNTETTSTYEIMDNVDSIMSSFDM